MHSHLRRLTRTFESHPVYFITTNTQYRSSFLACAQAVDILTSEWRDARSRHGWGIGRYVVMPDHVHFFCAEMPLVTARPASAKPAISEVAVAGIADPGALFQPTAKRLHEFMRAWKQWTAKRIVSELGRSAPIWQPEFFDHILRGGESYAQKWEYVRQNPVRKQLVAKADEWPWQGFVDFDAPLPSLPHSL